MIAIMHDVLSQIFEGSRRIVLAPGEALFLTGAEVAEMYLVREGRVLLVRHTESGSRLVLHQASAGTILAEASAYSLRYHCDAVAAVPSEVSAVPRARFRETLAADSLLGDAWAGLLAQATQAARLRAEIRTLPRVAARLDAWIEAGNRLPDRGHIQNVAGELGISREALYRELSRRRRNPDPPPHEWTAV